MNVRTFVASTSLAAVVLVAGCATTAERFLGAEPAPEQAPPFVADAGTDALDTDFELTNYCPSSKCTGGRTTCPSSRFPCDIDLRSDPNNCGSCGFVCPKSANGATFACGEGKCQMQCQANPLRLDCNGIIDDGCEIAPNTNENCGGCGITCTDPANPCVKIAPNVWKCGCVPGRIPCVVKGETVCLDPREDNDNCGACNNECDPTNDGAVSYPNAYYGCKNSECGHLKCQSGWGDCNSKAGEEDVDGCETFLLDPNHCGDCGTVCAEGQQCLVGNEYPPQPTCMCPPGSTLCAKGLVGSCVDINNDARNCGGCGNVCPPSTTLNTLYPVCVNGSCETRCETGFANCNGNVDDGCEVQTDFDPHNCGECGHECDAVAGQACIGGRCAVEPCDADAGEVVTQ